MRDLQHTVRDVKCQLSVEETQDPSWTIMMLINLRIGSKFSQFSSIVFLLHIIREAACKRNRTRKERCVQIKGNFNSSTAYFSKRGKNGNFSLKEKEREKVAPLVFH